MSKFKPGDKVVSTGFGVPKKILTVKQIDSDGFFQVQEDYCTYSDTQYKLANPQEMNIEGLEVENFSTFSSSSQGAMIDKETLHQMVEFLKVRIEQKKELEEQLWQFFANSGIIVYKTKFLEEGSIIIGTGPKGI